MFRQSFRKSLLLAFVLLLLLSSFSLIQGLLEVPNQWGYRSFDLFRWGFAFFSQSIRVALLTLSLPLLSLTLYGEWLQTRSLQRMELLALLRREYLRWWAGISLVLLGLTYWSQSLRYDSGRELSWESTLLVIGMSLILALLMCVSPAQLLSLSLPAALLLLWLIYFSDWQAWGLPLGRVLAWGGGFGFLFLLYRQIFQYQGDLFIDASLDLGQSSETLTRLLAPRAGSGSFATARGWRGRLQQFVLFTQPARQTYLQLLFVGGLGLLVLTLIFLRNPAFVTATGIDTLYLTILQGGCVGMGAMILLIPPRMLGQKYWEFWASRPQNAFGQYLGGWALQGGLLLGLAGFALILGGFQPEIWQYLQLGAWCEVAVFFLLGGEVLLWGGIFLFGLSITLAPALFVAFLAVLHTPAWPAWLLWGMALLVRLYDLYRFRQGFWEPLKAPLQIALRAGRHYALPGILFCGLAYGGIQAEPLPRLISQSEGAFHRSAFDRWLLSSDIIKFIYLKDTKSEDWGDPWEERRRLNSTVGLQRLLVSPWDADAALLMAESALETGLKSSWPGSRRYAQDEDARQEVLYYSDLARFWLKAGEQGLAMNQVRIQAKLAQLESQPQAALKALQEVVKQAPQPEDLLQMAELQQNLLQYRQALATLQDLALRFPAQAGEAWFRSGNVAQEAGLSAEALAYYQRSAQIQFQADQKSLPEAALWGNSLLRRRPELCADKQIALTLPSLQTYFKALKGRFSAGRKLNSVNLACQAPEVSTGRQPDVWHGAWYLAQNQPEKALPYFSSGDLRGWKAEALRQAGSKQAALKLAQNLARPWRYLSDDVYRLSYYYRNAYDTEQYLVHRILLLLEPKPGKDSGLHVLLRSTEPELDWPLVEQAFAAQPQIQLELKRLHQALQTFALAYAKNGALNLSHHRSWPQLYAMLMLSKTLPAELRRPEFLAAEQVIQKAVKMR
ncbi:hypothetical protein COW36_24225 [bacterium (Candidatus Blackallbacteria) CG17_big_fil_post_rev_8_21_14_2_50_48_46]|uniref:Uncharacterized protein n=1 Tax=bacterium (Candidatus Blackallbacteria) CG17_big_fil_post_rev_8_21_14_2_50_48_46 TaxID=2014261 RepID=A0A2M7FWZ0_9BACT|nr:MAG: hypothetical protein COW64_19165 [bacterium (Candidatus Blackallbacteria) CG18_big_fil_WC_8_21_14_2_50_49_26]PIW13778.1 MAG: hypothetical protein COW36_24225 [bacterium (Candidatus Blackallbacteria) CG17_big_fil_post_rev_8_21_14_2_50_48_46]PIW45004.1 MAG: hypothetical protein COW20_21855 [bacterium (Candidatus Blackallbacteria) CG13_big_fil_rev_8_21_14_2_50_49_14]